MAFTFLGGGETLHAHVDEDYRRRTVPIALKTWPEEFPDLESEEEEEQIVDQASAARNRFASACRSFHPMEPFRSTRGRNSQNVSP